MIGRMVKRAIVVLIVSTIVDMTCANDQYQAKQIKKMLGVPR